MIAHAADGLGAEGVSTWITILVLVIQFLSALVIALLGFFMKTLVANIKEIVRDMKTLAGELKEFQLNVAHTGVMREHFEQYRQETRQRLHDIGDTAAQAKGAAEMAKELVMEVLKRKRDTDGG